MLGWEMFHQWHLISVGSLSLDTFLWTTHWYVSCILYSDLIIFPFYFLAYCIIYIIYRFVNFHLLHTWLSSHWLLYIKMLNKIYLLIIQDFRYNLPSLFTRVTFAKNPWIDEYANAVSYPPAMFCLDWLCISWSGHMSDLGSPYHLKCVLAPLWQWQTATCGVKVFHSAGVELFVP